jgi:hypothetical protein
VKGGVQHHLSHKFPACVNQSATCGYLGWLVGDNQAHILIEPMDGIGESIFERGVSVEDQAVPLKTRQTS